MREKAKSIFFASLKGADPKLCVKRFLMVENGYILAGDLRKKLNEINKILVVGAGKASALMAQATEEVLGDEIDSGAVVSKTGYQAPLKKIKLYFGGHPYPDENGVKGTQMIIETVSEAGENDLVISLFSGGGSSLLVSPFDGISLEDKKRITRLLLECGANIDEINTIRKHISKVKGGRLAKLAYPAQIVSLILSDVIGDRLDSIASGPTAPDPTTFKDCLEVLFKYKLMDKIPKSIKVFLENNQNKKDCETLKPGDLVFEKVKNIIVGSNLTALKEAQRKAKELDFNTLMLSSTISGDTRKAALEHAELARRIKVEKKIVPPPACVISGGETTVEVKGKGLGGRNQEFVLVSAIEIDGLKNVVIASLNTDGTDGPTDAAGAICDGFTVSRAKKKNLDPKEYLDQNDSYHFFQQLGDLIKTGPTNTNVMDIHIILVG